jgi:ABC-type branched-subunit amino acid transport system permease subunit
MESDAPATVLPAQAAVPRFWVRPLAWIPAAQRVRILSLLVLAAALAFPLVNGNDADIDAAANAASYAALALGLNIVVGFAGLLDLGYAAFFAIGAYTYGILSSFQVQPHWSAFWAPFAALGLVQHMPDDLVHFTLSFWLALPFSALVAAFFGVLFGAPTLRLRGDYLAIVTLGFGEIIRIMAVNANGVTNGPRGVSPEVPHPTLNLGFIRLQWGLNNLQYWYLLLFFVVIVVLLFRRLEHSRTGRAWAAIREDEVAAAATGINTTRTKLLAFAIGASTSGLAGVLFASQVGFFNPDNFILANSILVVAYVVFGGMGSLPGVMVGAASLVWLQEFLRDQVPPPDRQMWVGALLLLMMIFRPGGLIPARRRRTELRGLEIAPSSETVAVAAGEGMGADVR